MILTDCPELRSVNWRCVVIDEAHRLKNRNCKLLEGLKMMDMVSGGQGLPWSVSWSYLYYLSTRLKYGLYGLIEDAAAFLFALET